MRRVIKKNRKISQEKNILTPSGVFRLVRDVDYCENCKKTFPQGDAELNINETFRATSDFIEVVAFVAQMVPSFGNAADLLSKVCDIQISVSQVQKIAENVGENVYETQMAAANYAYEKPEIAAVHLPECKRKSGILYIMTDGSAVNTRVQDENGSTWKEMKLGMVFCDKDIRTQNKHTYIDKKEYVAYFGCVDEFKKMLFDAAARAGYGSFEKVVVIGDGAKWIWNMCADLFPDAVQVLDLFHLKENIYDYAKALFPNDEKKYTRWAKSVAHYVETDQVTKAILKIKQNPLPDTASKNVVNLAQYITNNMNRIDYLKYKNCGYYVGSGMIESGNKVVVQKRLKQAGMRWGQCGAQYMVALRAKYESNKWADVRNLVLYNRYAA